MAQEAREKDRVGAAVALVIAAGGAGLALWYYLAKKKPPVGEPQCPEGQIWNPITKQCIPAQPVHGELKSNITSASVYPVSGPEISKGSYVRLKAKVNNVGDTTGYFKVFGFLYNTSCPAGSSGYGVSGWDDLVKCVADNTKGIAFESDWISIKDKELYQFDITSKNAVNWTGYAHLWIVAAVSTEATTESRVKANEHYYFARNIVSVKEVPVTAGPLAHISARTYSAKA